MELNTGKINLPTLSLISESYLHALSEDDEQFYPLPTNEVNYGWLVQRGALLRVNRKQQKSITEHGWC